MTSSQSGCVEGESTDWVVRLWNFSYVLFCDVMHVVFTLLFNSSQSQHNWTQVKPKPIIWANRTNKCNYLTHILLQSILNNFTLKYRYKYIFQKIFSSQRISVHFLLLNKNLRHNLFFSQSLGENHFNYYFCLKICFSGIFSMSVQHLLLVHFNWMINFSFNSKH